MRPCDVVKWKENDNVTNIFLQAELRMATVGISFKFSYSTKF